MKAFVAGAFALFDGSTYLFVWARDVDHDARAFLAVVDVDRSSATHGQVALCPL